MSNELSKEEIKKDFNLKRSVIEEIRRGFKKRISELKKQAKAKTKK